MTRAHSSSPTAPLLFAEFDTPLGVLAVVTDPAALGDRPAGPSGPVIASGFKPAAVILAEDPVLGSGRETQPDPLADIEALITRYFAGEVAVLDAVPVYQHGGTFFLDSWAALREVPAGEVVTYGELAAAAGRPRAARAAGTACATNQVAPFVPCHRVVPAGGGIGSYGYGAQVKAELLEHEGVLTRDGAIVFPAPPAEPSRRRPADAG